MNRRTIRIVRTGTGNVASVQAALRRCGHETCIVEEPESLRTADGIIVPGVGAFAVAMARLRQTGLMDALSERIATDRPTLLICLGLQLLCEESEESPGVAGLGIVPGRVTRFSGRVRIPQLGWNRVESAGRATLVSPGYAYFANSYKLERGADGWQTAYAVHGERFVAAIQRGNVLACQFHPELSGPWGISLIRRWLDTLTPEGARKC